MKLPINIILFLSFITLWTSGADGFEPEIHSTTYDSVSTALLYFDDSSNVLNLNRHTLYISKDDGKQWNKVEDLPNSITGIWSDSVNRKRAFAFTESEVQYITNDSGETWSEVTLSGALPESIEVQTNYANPKLILFTVKECEIPRGRLRPECHSRVFYTDDGFATSPAKPLPVENVSACTFMKTNANFDIGDDKRVLCITQEYDSFHFVKDAAVFESTDWFKTSTPVNDRTGLLSSSFVLEVKVVESFVIATVQTDRYDKLSGIEFYVSKDGSTFRKADFNVDLKKSMYMVLPSTPDSLHIATWSYKNALDVFPSANVYRSDSSGLYYTESASNLLGGVMGNAAVDKVQNIDGAWIANEISGTDAMSLPYLKSRISVDDGITWNVLKVLDEDCSNDEKCSLNLLSTKERDGEGRLVTGPTPGLLMGVGNVGQHSNSLTGLMNSHTYISRDGGLHWKRALKNPSAFSFGDQGNIILAFPYMSASGDDTNNTRMMTDEFAYSLDQGETWERQKLDHEIYPLVVTSTIDGSSTKFILAGMIQDESARAGASEIIYSIDFSKAHDGKKCEDSDFEDWYARSPEGPEEGQCLFGHKEKFRRRKQFAECFVNRLFDDVKVIEESCECSENDYECALGFVKDQQGDCQPDAKIIADYFCKKSKSKKISLPVRQKIPGSLCKGGAELDKTKQEFNCKDILEEDRVAAIFTKSQSFEGSISQYYYLRQPENASLADETLVLRTSNHDVYYSFNGGESFYKFDALQEKDDEFIAIYLNPYFADHIYLITSNSKLYISKDRGINYSVYKAPSDINEFGLRLLSFNKKDPNKFIWFGEKNCENFFSNDCKSAAYQTTNGGHSFELLMEDIRSCYYVGSIFDSTKYDVDQNLIFCEQKVKNANHLSLIASTDNFVDNKQELFSKIVGIAITGEFVVVAAINTDLKSLEAHVTVDGKDFADAAFPPDFHVDRQQAYTIIDSATKALFIHVTTNSDKDGEFGTILKSNSNGTSYVKSMDNVNRNAHGYVDYEKVEGLEGVSLINIVENPEQVISRRGSKKLKTMISHNDGSEWSFINPPPGTTDKCSGSSLKQCSLNLHGFTERADLRDTYSSGSAIGMLIGVGNVGEQLLPFTDESTGTFMTKDGGITWKKIKDGNYMWEYGDQGTILVLAPANGEPSDSISFSLTEGDTWSDYKFVDEPVTILDLATVPSDTARRFLVFGRNKSNVLIAFTIDFTHIHQRQCKLDFDAPAKDDFEYWSPKHPFLAENCLFGHESMYLRRISFHSDCFIGAAPLNNAYKEVRNCVCTRKDYECDYNYAKAADGTCKLVGGLSPPDHSEVCSRDSSLTEYWEPTGYRKIPLSTCEGGKELDKWISHPCPGKESEFRKKYSIKGFALFLTIFVPIAVFMFATWFVYDRGIRRNGGFARFGQIRLDEDDFHPIENNQTDKVVNDIVKGLILAVGAAITLKSIAKNKVMELFSRRNRYERVFGQDHDGILDDDSLFDFNDIDNDDDATEINSFIQQNDDDFNTVAVGKEPKNGSGSKDSEIQLGDDDEDDLTNLGSS